MARRPRPLRPIASAAAGPSVTRSTARITIASGACRSTTTAGSSSSCARGRAGGARLDHDPPEARGLPARLRSLRSPEGVGLRGGQDPLAHGRPGDRPEPPQVHAAIQNARAFLALRKELGSFDRFLWRFVEGAPRTNAWKSLREVPRGRWSRTPSAGRSASAASRSSARRSATPSCSPPAWSTTTRPTASATPRSLARERRPGRAARSNATTGRRPRGDPRDRRLRGRRRFVLVAAEVGPMILGRSSAGSWP